MASYCVLSFGTLRSILVVPSDHHTHGETHVLKIITTINVLDKGINIAMFDNSLLAAARLILSLFCCSYRRL